jgi:pimeloyl-ACP methyl ester carboxylesterase
MSGFTGRGYVEILRNITSPMTLVYGNSSELLRRSDVDRFVKVANGARTIWLDGGHNLHHDAPDALARIIDEHAGSAEHISLPARELMPSPYHAVVRKDSGEDG